MKLSVIIPVFNEAATLDRLIEKVDAVPMDKEVIIVDDGSFDGTRAILKQHGGKKNFTIIHHSENQGKGASIRTATEHISGDIVIIQDADLEYDPKDYEKLAAPIINEETRVVYGSRNLNKRNERSYLRYYLGGLSVTCFFNVLYGRRITDLFTCYKAMESSLFRSIDLKSKRFGFCPEITAQLAKKGLKIKEIPIRYVPRKIQAGKKIRWHDGLEALWILIKLRFGG
jgi:dolichol-phosphate mannosyltransferase